MKSTNRFSASVSAIYETLEINDDAVRRELEETASQLIGARRHSTEASFELGEYLERAAQLLPDGLLDKWVVQRCDYTPRHARTYRAIHRNLSPYKDTLVELAVGSTVLGKLSAAEPDKIQRSIEFAKERGKLRVADVAQILADEDADEGRVAESPFDIGGIDGLKLVIAAKIQEGVKSFLGHIEEIRAEVAAALLEKRIVKKTLALQIQYAARLARKELESLTQFVTPSPHAEYIIWTRSLPSESRWHEVGELLHQVGGIDDWPEKEKVRSWLEDEVLPVLEWASTKTKHPSWPKEATTSLSVAESVAPTTVAAATPEQIRRPVRTDAPSWMQSLNEAVSKPRPEFKPPAFLEKGKAAAKDTAEAAPVVSP
jgi:hypothetical protein